MEFGNPKKKGKKKDQPKKMTLAAFGPWIKEKCGAEYMIHAERVDCVASIDLNEVKNLNAGAPCGREHPGWRNDVLQSGWLFL